MQRVRASGSLADAGHIPLATLDLPGTRSMRLFERALPSDMEMWRHTEPDGTKEVDGMHGHENQRFASQLARPGPSPLAGELLRHAHEPAAAEAKDHAAETAWHNLDGLVVQRSDAHRILIISGRWVHLSPTQYAVLLPLLEQFGHPVSHAEIYQRAFACSYSAQDSRRIYYHIDKLRPRLSPFGLMIRTIIDYGYMLLREP